MTATRRHLLRVASALGLAALRPAHALMAGALPDSPAARVDPNTAASSWTSAVSVLVAGNAFSGVVVAPGHVLTAAHVTGAAAPATVTVQVNASATPVLIGATAIATFPGASFPYDDLALITLATPAPADVEVLPIYRQALATGQTVTLVGHGWSGAGDAGPTVAKSASIKRSGRNAIDAVQTTLDASGRTSLFYVMDFDGPIGGGTVGAGTLGNSIETGFASGDSGSPAFASIAGQRWLIGINNFVAPPAGSTAVDFRFGTLCGGVLLSDPRFIAWLTTQTQGTLGNLTRSDGEVPLPLWALALLGTGLAAGAARCRQKP